MHSTFSSRLGNLVFIVSIILGILFFLMSYGAHDSATGLLTGGFAIGSGYGLKYLLAGK